jgi:4-alpha-glucanotransferase
MRGLIASETFGQNVQACRSKHLVDYAEVAAIKLSVLERLFAECRGAADPARWRPFDAFRRRPPALRRHRRDLPNRAPCRKL